MKKLFCFILCLAMLVGAMSSCDFSDALGGAAEASSEQSEESSTEDAPEDEVPEVFEDTEGLEYRILDDGSCEVISAGSATDAEVIVIPATVDGRKVRGIDRCAFSGHPLKTLVVSEGIEYILAEAFHTCRNLEKISLPDTITEFGASVFWNTAYYNDESNWDNKILYIGNHLADSKDTASGDLIVREGTKTIAQSSLVGTKISSITIPDSVVSIGHSAMVSCENLTKITVGSGLRHFENKVFLGTKNIQSVEIRDLRAWCLIEFGDEDSNPLAVAHQLVINDGKGGLVANDGLLQIPDGITEIRNFAFLGCTSFVRMKLPESLTSIGTAAFRGCEALESMDLSRNVECLGDGAFLGCTSLERISLFNVKEIGDAAFENCISLEMVDLPDTLTELGVGVFQNCSKLQNARLGRGLTEIPELTFGQCGEMMDVTIPEGIIRIGVGAFRGSGITQLQLPSTLTEIGESAFSCCPNLVHIELPETVERIGAWAFSGCRNVSMIDLPDSLTTIPEGAFMGCYTVASLTLGAHLESIGVQSFENMYRVTTLTIPKSVRTIGEWAFNGWNGLMTIFFTGSESEWKRIDKAQAQLPEHITVQYNYSPK